MIKIKPTKRTLQIGTRRYFLEFPEILLAGDKFAIELEDKFYYLPLPNIDYNNHICHGAGNTIADFWTTAFYSGGIQNIKNCLSSSSAIFEYWQENGFDAIKKYLKEMPVILSFPFKHKNIDRTELLKLIRNDGSLLAYINPNERDKEMVLASVNHNGLNIKFIHDNKFKKDNEVLFAALKNNGEAIQYISRPTQEMKEIAVNSNPSALQFIDRPNKKIYIAAIKSKKFNEKIAKMIINGGGIYIAPNIDHDIRLLMASRCGNSIKNMSNAKKSVLLAAINENPLAIRFIKNPDTELQRIAVSRDHRAFSLIKNPSPKVVALFYNRKRKINSCKRSLLRKNKKND